MSGLGYFAFPPPGTSQRNVHTNDASPTAQSQRDDVDVQETPGTRTADTEARHRTEEREPEGKHSLEDAKRQQRLESERALAMQSEMEYVRMGLSIRDKYGRIDKARTDYLRGEVRRRDALSKLIDQWNTYEARWRTLLATNGPVTFADIPWPTGITPSSVDELSPESIIQFFADSLSLPELENALSEQDRLRAALLRWHPDKLSGILSRTVDSDLDSVREGVNVVFRTLHARMNHLRLPRESVFSQL
ncbi:hypothetical protein BD414DRAFT_486983 [Trametes punicea]|nr:hypothetical protein BD414DRAFT_486983 [Trametes punicea]